MNIFYLDRTPQLAARALCDQHITKMPLESAQLACTVVHSLATGDDRRLTTLLLSDLYRPSYPTHPCQLWLQHDPANIKWFYYHASELFELFYEHRQRRHASEPVFHTAFACISELRPEWRSATAAHHTPPALAVKDYPRDPADPVGTYRRYYIADKASFATWGIAPRSIHRPPAWWPHPQRLPASPRTTRTPRKPSPQLAIDFIRRLAATTPPALAGKK